ncbi:maltose ABC transporter substrate-binding protein [Bacillus sp. UMB0899]|uniref:sugar ABC transporter substrate-binding protein n=1 Tax=Metabacillus schmidteae TaxID=2730405 RepID=UPI000C80F0E8|nr:maltose ABC transporter substrate-binding protein [Metabacillus schmidteae]PMC34390.1 maltose ABC transporter substrate-binding protein [Bacillus sp. UMB0899]
MKKVLSLFFVALFIVVLAACSKPGGSEQEETKDTTEKTSTEATVLEPEEGAELVLWSNGDQEAEWAEYVAGEFTNEYGIPVTVEEVSHTDAAGKLETDGPAGLGGDVFTGAHDHVGNMEVAGLIYDNYFADEYKERFMEGAVTAVSANSDGEYKMFGYPLAIETVGLFYNQDLLDQMGFEPAETMEELMQQSKEFMGKNPGSYGFMVEPGNFYLIHGFLGGYGGYIFGENNTNPEDIGLNNEGGLKAAELMKKIHDEILPLKKEDITGDVISSQFNEGKLLYYITGPWAVKGHQEAGVNFGVKTMPKLDNGEVPTTFSSVKSLFVNAYSDYPKAATLLAQFATTDEMLLKRYEMTGQLPPSNALLEDETIKSDELNLAFLEQSQYSISMPNIPAMQHVWAGMEVAFTSLWNGESEPKAALDKGVQQIKDAIDSQTK